MFNASDLLGALLQGGGPRGRSTSRLEHAMGGRGAGAAGGPLGQILGQLGGGTRGGGTAQGGGGLLGGLAGPGGSGGYGSRAGGGGGGRDLMMGGLGALAATILAGRGRSAGLGSSMGRTGGGGNLRGAVGAGGLALLGMLAMQALRNRGDGGGGSARPAATGFTGLQEDAAADPELPPEQTVSDRTAALVLRAMIDAAKADGRVDATERQRILAKAQENGAADPEAATFLQRAFERPADPDALAAEAAGDPVIAAQVYAASLLAIEVDTADERDYLRDLAQKLRLAPGVAAQLHTALGAPPP